MILEKYILDLAEGRRSAPVLSWFLALLSRLYYLGVRGRHLAYQKKWLPTFTVSIPTVSVGNLTIGGTGKTPLVQMLANTLQTEGRIAILTRGYRSRAEKGREPICLRQGDPTLAHLCGDEPLLLSRTTSARVWVGANRVLSAQRAEADGAVCLILDDGFQHRRLSRDIDIVTLDANDPVGQNRFLPYGLLRDLPERLKEADLIVANHTRDVEHYEEIKKELASYSEAPVVAMRHVLVEPLPLEGSRVGAFCGIGKPHYFFEALKEAGSTIVATSALRDHEGFPTSELKAFAEVCRDRGAPDLVCTEKDWVKLDEVVIDQLFTEGTRILPVGMCLEIVAGREYWDSMIEKIKQKVMK